MVQTIAENQNCDHVLIEFASVDYVDRIQLPMLQFDNRETITTYKVAKYTKAENLRQSYDAGMRPTDTVYSMSFLDLRKKNKDAFKAFYEKYAGVPVWMKGADCVWRYGYILNSGIVITTAQDKNCGTYGVEIDVG